MIHNLRILSLFYGDEDIFASAKRSAVGSAADGDWLPPHSLDGIVVKLRQQGIPLPRQQGIYALVKSLLYGKSPPSESLQPYNSLVPTDRRALVEFNALFNLANAIYTVNVDNTLKWRGDWNERRLIRDCFPCELLQSARIANEQRTLQEAPLEDVCGDDLPLRMALKKGLSDNHIHMAAAIPFWELLPLALSALRFPDAAERDAFDLNEKGRVSNVRSSRPRPKSVYGLGTPDEIRRYWLGYGDKALRERIARTRIRDAMLTLKALMIALHDFRESAELHDTFGGFLKKRLDNMPNDIDSMLWTRLFPSPFATQESDSTWRMTAAFGLNLSSCVSETMSPACLRRSLAEQSPFPAKDASSLSQEVYANFLRLHTHFRDDDFSFYWLQAVRLICWLYRTTRHGKGFYEFEVTFDALDWMLEAAGLRHYHRLSPSQFPAMPSIPPDHLVKATLNALSRDQNLRCVELRFAVRIPPRRDSDHSRVRRFSSESLHRELQEFRSAANCVPHIKTNFAIHLIRKTDEHHECLLPPGVCAEGFALPFENVWQRVGVITELLTDNESHLFHCPIDVASNEDKLPNWIFAAAFAEIRERFARARRGDAGRLRFQAHAGEHFHTPLHGLRRLWETVEFMKPLERIGHALALHAPNVWPRELFRQEYYDDLVWASTRLTELGLQPELAAFLENKALEMAPGIVGTFPCALTRNILWQAYCMRFYVATWQKSVYFEKTPKMKMASINIYIKA